LLIKRIIKYSKFLGISIPSQEFLLKKGMPLKEKQTIALEC